MQIDVRSVQGRCLWMKTRFPFRYGIASMTEVPHLFLFADVDVEGRIVRGVSADGLPPKWFSKNPETAFADDDLPAMNRSISRASDVATQIHATHFFDWWMELYSEQLRWAKQTEMPPLMAGLGVSLLERCVLDAICRRYATPISVMLKDERLRIDLQSVRPDLSLSVADVLDSPPRSQVALRHTVGLGDPLDASDLDEGEGLDDGLPYTLAESIDAYGLTHFKIKMSGVYDADRERLERISRLLSRQVGAEARITVDANENYVDIDHFEHDWQSLLKSPDVRRLVDASLMFVEQPIHRSRALDRAVCSSLANWSDAPPIIIDESDSELESLPTALELGYTGTSHKNCKLIVKSLANGASLQQLRQSGVEAVQSAEDLGNVGPVALLQDLAIVAALGIDHVERNGHHYFRGLSMYPEELQRKMVECHGDLYHWHSEAFATLRVSAGQLQLNSVNRAPFGIQELPGCEHMPLWEFA